MELSRKFVYVGNLPINCDEATIHAAFIPFGEISQIILPKGSATQTGLASEVAIAKNYAMVEYEDAEDGEHAIFNMNESEFWGKVLSVHWAKNSQKQAILGKHKAVWHQTQTVEEGGQADTVVVDSKPLQKQGLVPIQ